MTKQHEQEPVLLVTDGVGIYLPQEWAVEHQMTAVMDWGIDGTDLMILLDGPEREEYWDAWDDVLRDAEYTDKDGITWTLYHDGDLWAIPEGFDFEAHGWA